MTYWGHSELCVDRQDFAVKAVVDHHVEPCLLKGIALPQTCQYRHHTTPPPPPLLPSFQEIAQEVSFWYERLDDDEEEASSVRL